MYTIVWHCDVECHLSVHKDLEIFLEKFSKSLENDSLDLVRVSTYTLDTHLAPDAGCRQDEGETPPRVQRRGKRKKVSLTKTQALLCFHNFFCSQMPTRRPLSDTVASLLQQDPPGQLIADGSGSRSWLCTLSLSWYLLVQHTDGL
jgi:hypothetical protein